MNISQQENSQYFTSLSIEVSENINRPTPETLKAIYPSKERSLGHYNSRLALLKVVNQLRPIGAEISFKDLAIENHHFLLRFPEVKVSLTHTKSLVGAVVTDHQSIDSIGIDLEFESREIKNGVHKFYIRSDDEFTDPLELWCIKEAAFKAAFPIYKGLKALVLKDIIVCKNGSFRVDTISGYYQVKKVKGHIMALALILKTS